MLRKRGEKGFTLIELLIVIAIIGILAAIAIPVYKAQTIKARMTEVTNSMSVVASSLSTYYQENQVWPGSDLTTFASISTSLGVNVPAGRIQETGTLVSGGANGGVITFTVQSIDSTVDDKNLVLTPNFDTNNAIRWDWSTANGMPPAYIPKR